MAIRRLLPQQILQPPNTPAGSVRDDRFAAKLRGFGPLGILAILLILLTGNISVGNVMLPAGAVVALAWTRLSRTPWREIGYVRPESWIVSVVVGVLFGTALKFVMKAIVMPLLGADPINHAFQYLVGNRAALPSAVWMMFVAGFGEETVFRGYLFERLGKLFGSGAAAKTSAVLLTAALFGAAHYLGQGLAGTEQAAILGLAFGTIYAYTGKLFMLMCAHTAFDLTALTMIYWNLEFRVAHLVFQ